MNLSALAAILVNIIAPIVVVAALGFILGRALQLDARALSRVALYLLAPSIVFTSTLHAQIGADFFSIAAFVLIITALMGLLTAALAKLMRYDQPTASAFALSTMFANVGNYGLPLVLFAFGDEGLARGVIFFTVSAMLGQTLAVFIASRGRAEARQAILNVFKLPLVYAFFGALALNQAGIAIPAPLTKSLDLLAGAAVPVMLVILGIELAHVSFANDRLAIGISTVVKLVVTPVVAFALAALMGLQGLTRAVCIIEASMPTAVLVSILAVEFKARPEFVTGVVLVSTIASVVTLTVLLGILL
ncbi:MAG: AEC family transporter [Chloroflexi bacterium]|nr:AEC family transporter [Chloroflexota bacterium]